MHLHNEVSRRELNGDSPACASFFAGVCGVDAVGAGSNERTVGRFSFCGILPDPYSLPVSLFRGSSGGSGSERYPSAMYRSSSVTHSKRAVVEVVSSFSHGASPSGAPLPSGRRTAELSFYRYRESVVVMPGLERPARVGLVFAWENPP